MTQKPGRQHFNQVIKISVISKWTIWNCVPSDGCNEKSTWFLWYFCQRCITWIMMEHYRSSCGEFYIILRGSSRSWMSSSPPKLWCPFLCKPQGMLVQPTQQEPEGDGNAQHGLSASATFENPAPSSTQRLVPVPYIPTFPLPSPNSFLSSYVFHHFWNLWFINSTWMLTSDFLNTNLGL